ncbi:MAG: hypothetical protein HY719_11165 [Planctomycetes bacterium]|nr:hypothetical protein [Planctomycetota bacterium]
MPLGLTVAGALGCLTICPAPGWAASGGPPVIFPEAVATFAPDQDRLFVNVIYLTGIAFAAVTLALLYFIVRYGTFGNRPRPAAYFHGETRRAKFFTLGLALVVFVGIDLNIDRWSVEVGEVLRDYPDPASDPSVVHVQVLGKQFEWLFRYAGDDGQFGTEDDVRTVGKLVIPRGRRVLADIRAVDVIHSFFIPTFRVKQDAVPGRTTRMWFEATRTSKELRDEHRARTVGVHAVDVSALGLVVDAECRGAGGEPLLARGDEIDSLEVIDALRAAGHEEVVAHRDYVLEIACAELCGFAHFKMRAVLQVEEPEEFERWLRDKSEEARDLYDPEDPQNFFRYWGEEYRAVPVYKRIIEQTGETPWS